MKKVIIVAAIAAAAAFGTYIFQQQKSISPSYNVLDYVPADTPIFTGQLAPFPLKDYLTSTPAMVTPSEKQLVEDLYEDNNPRLNFFLNIFKTYQSELATPDSLLKTFGLPENLRAYFYTLGLLPVFKVEIDNPQAIWDLLDKNELETGFTHRKGTLQSLNYRAYPLTDEHEPAQLELIIAIDKGLLTLTINSDFNEQTLLAQALGLDKAEHSLAASKKIETLRETHQLTKESLGFINHIELVKGFTTVNSNLLAKHITAVEKRYKLDIPFSSVRNAQCEKELSAIADNWPRTVFGYRELAITEKESTLKVATIIESKNQAILSALQALRGYIPGYTENIKDNVFAMGIGLDLSQLTSSLTDIWQDLKTPRYSCQPLAELQAEIEQSGESIALFAMGANMANGVKGISLGLLDYTINQVNGKHQLENLDALLALSADNPQQIFDSLKMFSPELQDVQLSDNGPSVDLSSLFPIPARFKLAPKLAIKGKHLLIYNGEKGQQAAVQLATEPLSKNGLYTVSFDFKKIFTPVITAAELAGETIPEETRFLANYDTRMKMRFDINQQGLIFNSYINSRAEK